MIATLSSRSAVASILLSFLSIHPPLLRSLVSCEEMRRVYPAPNWLPTPHARGRLVHGWAAPRPPLYPFWAPTYQLRTAGYTVIAVMMRRERGAGSGLANGTSFNLHPRLHLHLLLYRFTGLSTGFPSQRYRGTKIHQS